MNKVMLRIILHWLLLSVCLAGFNGYAAEEAAQVSTVSEVAEQADIEIFVRTGCPHCAKAEAFLQRLQQEQPSLKIVQHDVAQQPTALARLMSLATKEGLVGRVPAIRIGEQLLIGYSDDISTGQLIRQALQTKAKLVKPSEDAGSCSAPVAELSCEAPKDETPAPVAESFALNFLGKRLSLADIGLPLFTLAMGLLDGFNPCSLWVLLLMISLLAPMQDRWRMLAVAGTFVVVEGIAYFVFMSAWLNLFLLLGLSRASEIMIALIALVAGAINLKDFKYFGKGFSLSIPASAKPGIYERLRKILSAQNLTAAILGAIVLALLVQVVEFMCTSGFPALYTRILTMQQLQGVSYYAYLLLYNLAYMLDDFIILGIGIYTLSHRRLQEQEGRWLKLISGLVMVGLGLYLLFGV